MRAGTLRRACTLNEGRGVSPGDTWIANTMPCTGSDAQRRPGREPRRHQPNARQPRLLDDSLNEGRGASPGDTAADWPGPSSSGHAQRRPGREPRRHSVAWMRLNAEPAAQRRPGREPRRHLQQLIEARRSETPLNEGRGVSPGDTTRTGSDRTRPYPPLNEGRGVSPGDTWRAFGGVVYGRHAQRRPGREPRRHCPGCPGCRTGP